MNRSFPAQAHSAFRSIRQGHFWFECRREILSEVLRQFNSRSAGRSLEVGCGDGFLLRLLPGSLRLGVDQNLVDLREASRVGCGPVVAARCEALPFKAGFSLIGAFDVLEHLEDESGFLRECRTLLGTGGCLAVTVPAGPDLWSYLDEFAGHQRRYDRQCLCDTVRRAGFDIVSILPLFRILRPLAWFNARRKASRIVRDPASEYSVSPWANAFLGRLIRWEWRFFGKSSRGRGTSWLLIARAGEASVTERGGS